VIIDDDFVLPEIESLSVTEALEITESQTSRVSISAEVFGKYNKRSSFTPKLIEKDEQTYQRLRTRLSDHWIFNSLQGEDKDVLVKAMKEETYGKGDIVIKQNEKGNRLFIIDKGSFR